MDPLLNYAPHRIVLLSDAPYLAFEGSRFVTGESRVTQLQERFTNFLVHMIADVQQSFSKPKIRGMFYILGVLLTFASQQGESPTAVEQLGNSLQKPVARNIMMAI